jgi:multiple sugar transport system ATP-binding protein
MSATIEIRNLTKRYGDVLALDDLSLTVQPGEFLVLLGPSGCGKTTLLRSLSGLETPDEGEIVIDDKVLFSSERGIRVAPGMRQIGMVFQSYALWPHMKVKDNIGFGLGVQKVPQQEIETRVEKILNELSMGGLGERYPSELSGGQQQRIALARLLATKPPVFLMDEPLSNLDARLRLDMRAELKRFHHDSDATTVFVTHDQTEAMTMASQIVIMNQGRIQQTAPPLDVYRYPANLFVAEFIGMPRINLLNAELDADAGNPVARIGDFITPLAWSPPVKELVIAARPEDVTLLNAPESDAVECRVHAVLPSGPELIIQLTRGEETIVVRETRQLDLAMDQTVWIKFDSAALNLYDRRDGTMLVPAAELPGRTTGAEPTEGLAQQPQL